jgi:hypothetical protein
MRSPRFAEHGLALPASDFFKGLLEYYASSTSTSTLRYLPHLRLRPLLRSLLGDQTPLGTLPEVFRLKPQPSANNPRVVGGAGIQMREDAAE